MENSVSGIMSLGLGSFLFAVVTRTVVAIRIIEETAL